MPPSPNVIRPAPLLFLAESGNLKSTLSDLLLSMYGGTYGR